VEVVLVALLVSIAAGVAAFLVFGHWPQADPALSAAKAIEGELERHRGVRAFVRARTNPSTTTGMVLTAAMGGLVLCGAIVGVLVWMIRRDAGLVNVDLAVERWAEQHATALSDDVLEAITHLGDTPTIIAVAVAISAYGLWRSRKPAIPLFVLSVVAGQIGRHRPSPARAPPARRLHRNLVPERAHDRCRGHVPDRGADPQHRKLAEGTRSAAERCRGDRCGRRMHQGAPRRALVL
jgi:hypothetical protein